MDEEVENDCGMREWSPSMVGTMSVIDRGDAPAQLVIEKNLKAQAQRQADQTKEELDRITSRVNKTMAAFELNEEMMDENKAAFFVPDLLELEKIISDTILKRRYQQQVMIFVVGFEEVTDQRLKLLSQINDFFGSYVNIVDDEEFKKKPEVDLEEVSTAVHDALETASSASQKLADINTEILSYVEKMTGGKAASKSKKKLEKALQQAKDDIMSLTDKLQGAQAEIEDKEDQMTRLYKQIDMKSMEVLKYKNATEQAKKKLDQVTELQLEISERDEEIERLNKALDDSQLSLKQLENSKENSFARLKAANDEGEQTIEKLQRKIQALNVQLGESWNDSQKQFEVTLQQVREEHREELESVKESLQARIDELEEEALNQPRGWASDSEDERELSKSVSRASGYLYQGEEIDMTEVASNATSMTQPREPGWDIDILGDGERELKSGLSSRQPSSIRKQDLQSRQTTDTSIKPTPQPPATPKSLEPPTPKNINKVIEDDSSRNKNGTPKKAMRTKSNLEPVHEVPFEEKIPLEEEERWSKVPQEQLPSAFKQYRKEALLIVHGLQTQIKTNQEENHKKVKQLRNHIQVKEEKWDKERQTLILQVDKAREGEKEAEREADIAVAQLENFVKEHEQTTKNAIKQEKKALKTLTPEQRAKYLGEFNPMEMVKPIQEDKNGEIEKEEDETKDDSKSIEEKNEREKEIDETEKLNPESELKEEDMKEEKEVKDNKDEKEEEEAEEMMETADQNTQVDPVLMVEQEQQTSRIQSRLNPEYMELFMKLQSTGRLRKMPTILQEELASATVSNQKIQQALLKDTSDAVSEVRESSGGVIELDHSTHDDREPGGGGGGRGDVPHPLDDLFFDGREGDVPSKMPVSRGTQRTPQRKLPTKHAKKPANQRQRVGPRSKPHEEQPPPPASPTESIPNVENDEDDITKELMFEECDEYDEDNIDGTQLADHFEKLLASGLEGEDELDRPLSASSHHSQQSLHEKFRAQLEQRKLEMVERRSRATSMHGSLLSAKSGSYRDQAPSRDSSAVLTPQGDVPFPDEVPDEAVSAESSSRPAQQSAAVSFQDQMSQARLSTAGYQGRVSSHLVSRAPSVSESGVSMLETDEEDGGYSADEGEPVDDVLPRFIATATSAKLFVDVEKLDMATSPVAHSTVSRSSRQSIESIADHPVVQDYLKTYQHVTDFKDNVIKLVHDKDFGAALEQLAEIKTLQFDRDSNVQNQVTSMTYNVEAFLREIMSVFGTVMTTPEPEAAVSSLMVSRADTGKSRFGGQGLQLQSATGRSAIQEGLEREITDMTIQSSERVKEIQENYDKLKQEASKQQMEYEDKLNNNTVMIMEMQNTIQDLQQELQALGGSKAMSTPSRVSTATANRELQVEPTIIFSRSDSERNQRALKRGISAQRVTAEQYNEAVRAMEQYTVLPAKRLVHIVRKYSHHTEMKKIEDDVRHSNSIDQEVYTLLERMETLQSKRAQRWGEEMDNLTAERDRLAHLLMETLTHLEQESGIFMIKPILSWKGRGYQPHYQSKLSNYQPPKRLLRPITPEERRGTPFTIVPAPTPAHPGTRNGLRPGTRNSTGTPGGDTHRLFTPSAHIPNGGSSIKGSAVQMVGEVPQPMWSLSTSLPTPGGAGDGGGAGGGLTGRLNFLTTPRLLELDVNRLLIGQNTVSAATKALLSNDRLVNAANSSVRSYVTIARPSTHPPVPNLRPSRPNSSNDADKGKTAPTSPLPQSSSSAGPHGRKRSEGALQLSQPLPPIKVPSNNNNDEEENRTSKDTQGSDSGSRLHPSPPHTPPGSSLRHSPAIIDDDDLRQSQNASPGHITKVSMRSTSRSSEHNLNT